jgi:outer membrane protein TolC
MVPLLAALAISAGTLAAQTPLRLTEALREADSRAFANRQARAGSDADRFRATQPFKGLLPTARVEGGFIRTTDPIGAFGTTLRQRAVTPAAFDPTRLNDPAAVNNVQGGVVLEVPLLNGDALTGWQAARRAADAGEAMADWTVTSTRAQVIRAWYGTALAQEKAAMLDEARRAADAAVRQVESMVRQGLVTKADALQAQVRAADVAAQLLGARQDATIAGRQLAMLLGRTDGAPILSPSALPDSLLRRFAEEDTMSLSAGDLTRQLITRSDVRAATFGHAAAIADARRATTTLMPRLNGFARYDWNSPATLYAGRPNWTVGVMGSWTLFGGGTELGDVGGARARARAALAGEEAARTSARVEAESAAGTVRVALERLELAALSSTQSQEAWRLVQKRYGGGLATIAELLGAESSATGARLAHAAARFALIDALATYRRAIGADPGALAALDDSGVTR